MDLNKKLNELKLDGTTFLADYTQGMSFLHRSGIFEILREMAKCKLIDPKLPNYVNAQLSSAMFACGYTAALDDLYEFKDKYLTIVEQKMPELDFGSLDKALESGDLTKEEVDAIRSNKPIPYSDPSTDTPRKSGQPTGS